MTSAVGRVSEHLDRDRLLAAAGALRDAIGRRIIGQTTVVEDVLMALIAGGHALLVGVPGLAKPYSCARSPTRPTSHFGACSSRLTSSPATSPGPRSWKKMR